jgi:hypothetical protein
VLSQTARWPITETAQHTNTNNNGQGTGQNNNNNNNNNNARLGHEAAQVK